MHACTAQDLPYWLNAELWEVELDGAVRGERKFSAQRGRLVRRVDAWDASAARAFAETCAERMRETARRAPEAAEYLPDAETFAALGDAPTIGFVAARAAEVAAGPRAYDAERRAQAEWLADRLGLQLH